MTKVSQTTVMRKETGNICEGGERDTKAVMTEASNPGDAILLRV